MKHSTSEKWALAAALLGAVSIIAGAISKYTKDK